MKTIKVNISGNTTIQNEDWQKGWDMLSTLCDAIDGGVELTEDSVISGSISVPIISPSIKQKLNAKYGSTFVSCNERYIQFEDKEVARLIVDNLGYFPTVANPPSFETVKGIFAGNDKIEYFGECNLFQNVNTAMSLGSAFFKCEKLKKVSAPSYSVLQDTFGNCSCLEEVALFNGTTRILGAFCNCFNLRNITLSSTLSSLEYYANKAAGAFMNCCNLEHVDLPDSLQQIGQSAFQGCSKLTINGIPESVTVFGSSIFRYCSSLNLNHLPQRMTTIPSFCFDGCASLSLKSLGPYVDRIEQYAFCNCKSLAITEIPDKVYYLGDYAFDSCDGLKTISISDNITTISTRCFGNCTSLENVIFGRNVTTLGSSAFTNCAKLNFKRLPDSITSVGNNCFAGCSALELENWPAGETLGSANHFSGCTNLNIVEFGENATSIPTHCFNGCFRIYAVKFLSRTVLTIGAGSTYQYMALIFVRDELVSGYTGQPFYQNVHGLSEVDSYANSYGLKVVNNSLSNYNYNILHIVPNSGKNATVVIATAKTQGTYPKANQLVSPIPLPLGTTAIYSRSNSSDIRQDTYRVASETASVYSGYISHKAKYIIPNNMISSPKWVVYGFAYNSVECPKASDIDLRLFAEVGSTTYEFDQTDNTWKLV